MMSEKKVVKPVALAVGAALAGSFALAGTATADTVGSPFEISSLSAGYMLGAGEGSCGGDKGEKEAEGSCGDKVEKEAEGSCGESGEKEAEGSCGESAEKEAEGSCGEGSCGGSI